MNCLDAKSNGHFLSLFSLISSRHLKFSSVGFSDLLLLFYCSFLFVCLLLYNLCCQLLFFYLSPKWWSLYSIYGPWTTSFIPIHSIRNLNSSVILLPEFQFYNQSTSYHSPLLIFPKVSQNSNKNWIHYPLFSSNLCVNFPSNQPSLNSGSSLTYSSL